VFGEQAPAGNLRPCQAHGASTIIVVFSYVGGYHFTGGAFGNRALKTICVKKGANHSAFPVLAEEASVSPGGSL
jgi:hypothetical protein